MEYQVPSYSDVIISIRSFIKRYHWRNLTSGTLIFLGVNLGLLFIFACLAYFIELSGTSRQLLFWTFLSLSLYAFIRYILINALKLLGVVPSITIKQAAVLIGAYFPEIKDQLTNILDLHEQGESNSWAIASIQQKISGFKHLDFKIALPFKEVLKTLKYTLIPVLLIGFLGGSKPEILQEGTKKILLYNQDFEPENPFSFNQTGGKKFVVRNEDWEVNLKFTSQAVPNAVYININGRNSRLINNGNGHFSFLERNVQRDIEYKIIMDEFSTNAQLVKMVESPSLENFNLTLNFPSHTQRDKEEITSNGNLVIPEGTKVDFSLESKNADRLFFIFQDTTITNPKPSKRFLESTEYKIVIGNEVFEIYDTLNYQIDIIKDQYPEIVVQTFSDSINPYWLYFSGNIQDDYGFKSLSFKATVGDSSIVLPISINNKLTNQSFVFHLDCQPLIEKLDQNDLSYSFSVTDNDIINGFKSTSSSLITHDFPSKKELEEKIEQNKEVLKKDMEEQIAKSSELQKELEELRKQMLNKKNLDWGDKSRIENYLQNQKQLQESIKEINQQHQINKYQEKTLSPQEQRIAEKQQKINELFEQLMDDETKKLYEELEQLMDEMNKEKIDQKLEEINMTNEELEKELDRALELYKRMEVEHKMEKAIEELNQLAEKQESLSKDEQLNQEEKVQEQEKLNDAFEQLQEDLKQIQEENEQLDSPHDLDMQEDQQENIKNDLNESLNQLQKNNQNKAQKQQENSAQKMKKMAQQMQQMMMQQQMQQQMEDINSLRQILENLLSLSFDQEDLISNLQKVGRFDPNYSTTATVQGNLKDQAKIIEDSLLALSKRQIALQGIINKELTDINYNMEKSVDLLRERNTAGASINQRDIMTSVNYLALILDESLQQMQSQMQSQMSGSGSCSKPGGNPNSISDAKKLQKALSDQIQQLKKQMEEGNSPGESGKKGEKGMAKQFAKMAAQQQAIKEQLEKISENQKLNGSGGQGELEQLQQLLEQNERDLLNKNITQETISRQQEIMTKLLEAENALRERELDDKRESNEAKNEFDRNPSDFSPYKRLELSNQEQIKRVLPAFKIYFKRKVSDYFNKFDK